KKFAWTIGLALSTIMFLHMVVVNSYSFITGIICLTCLVFLFFESAFGICLGCLFYGLFHKEKAKYCVGDSCDAKVNQAIQKISLAQIAVVIGFIGLIILTSFIFNEYFSIQPRALWAIQE
ncbi:MAG: DUF4395 family protein, partial [Spirochaetales bacterium]